MRSEAVARLQVFVPAAVVGDNRHVRQPFGRASRGRSRGPPPRITLDTRDTFDTREVRDTRDPTMPIPAGQPAPNLSVSTWVQGAATNLDQQRGNVVLIEVFQVNCPGCFLTAIPEAIKVHDHFAGQPVTVLGIATAFEDWDKNNLDNLQRLVETGEVIGETRLLLERAEMLDDGKLRYRIPFPLAMDELIPVSGDPTREQAVWPSSVTPRSPPSTHPFPKRTRAS